MPRKIWIFSETVVAGDVPKNIPDASGPAPPPSLGDQALWGVEIALLRIGTRDQAVLQIPCSLCETELSSVPRVVDFCHDHLAVASNIFIDALVALVFEKQTPASLLSDLHPVNGPSSLSLTSDYRLTFTIKVTFPSP